MKSGDQVLLESLYSLIVEGNKETKQFLEKNGAKQDLVALFTKLDKKNKPIFATDHAIKLFQWIKNKPINIKEIEQNYTDYKLFASNKSLSDFNSYEDFVKEINTRKDKKKFEERNVNDNSQKNVDQRDVIADDDEVLILKANNEQKCVEYGKGYPFCISRPHGGNQYNSYRLEKGSTFYFIFFKKTPKSDPAHIMVLEKGERGWSWTFADNDTQQTSPDAIFKKFPVLQKYESKFINEPLSDKEKEEFKLFTDFRKEPTPEKFNNLTYEQKATALKYGMNIPSSIFDGLDKFLRNEYVSVGPLIERDIYDKLTPKEQERFVKVRKTVINQYGLHQYSTKLDREIAINDKELSAKYIEPDRLKAKKFYDEIASKTVNGVYKGTINYESQLTDLNLPELEQCEDINITSGLIEVNLPNLKKCNSIQTIVKSLTIPQLQKCSDYITCYAATRVVLPKLIECDVINAPKAEIIKVPSLKVCDAIQADNLKQIVISKQLENKIKSKTIFRAVEQEQELKSESFKTFFKTRISSASSSLL